jgi:hypothetical protein
MRKAAILVLVGVTLSGCYWPTRHPVANSAIIGGVTGAAVGAVATGSLGGAAVGAGIGAVTGAVIAGAVR